MARKPDSAAVAEPRVELVGIVGELRATRKRALALVRRLRRAAKTGEVLGKINAETFTVENDLAECIYMNVFDFDGALDAGVKNFARLVREDHRREALAGMKYYQDDIASGKK